MIQNIYLGIDGVILTKGVVPALHLDKFLKHIVSQFNVYWLSTRCRGGVAHTEKYLSQFLEQETIGLIRPIKTTDFYLDKTDAIDFRQDFYWLESELFDSEVNALKKQNKFSSWIKLDLIGFPNQLGSLTDGKLQLKRS